MEARILKWKELARNRTTPVEFSAMRDSLVQRDAAQREIERIDHLNKQIPLRFRGKTFDDFMVTNEAQRRNKQLVKRYVETFAERVKNGTAMQFLGRPGTGKTLLSLIVYQEVVKQGFKAKYESSTEFLKVLLEIKFQSQATFTRRLESLRQLDLIIIDEVTESVSKSGALSEIERQLLFRIINDRYENKRCTIVIANRDEAGLVKCLGLPIVERLCEDGISLAFNWTSFRQE